MLDRKERPLCGLSTGGTTEAKRLAGQEPNEKNIDSAVILFPIFLSDGLSIYRAMCDEVRESRADEGCSGDGASLV